MSGLVLARVDGVAKAVLLGLVGDADQKRRAWHRSQK